MRGEEGSKAAAVTAGSGLEADDGALLQAASRGDASSFARIVERHYDIVHRVTWRITSGHPDLEDIVQDAFLRLWKDPLQVREPGALRAWLLRVASNLAIDRSRRRPTVDIDEIPEPAAAGPGALERAIASNAATEVERAIARLPDRQRLALTLVHFEGQGNIEAAATMEISVEALESLLARARRTLKASFRDRWQGIVEDLSQARE